MNPRAMLASIYAALMGISDKPTRRRPKLRTLDWWAKHTDAREAGPTRPLVFGWGQNRKLNRTSH